MTRSSITQALALAALVSVLKNTSSDSSGDAWGSGGAVGLKIVRIQTVHRTRVPDKPSVSRPDHL